jgi:hypothetical protein
MRSALVFMVIGMLACGKSDEQKAAEAAAKQLEALGQAIGTGAAASGVPGANAAEATAALMAGKATDAVDFRELKALLPESLDGLKRENADGQKTGAMGFTMSTAEGTYRSEDQNSSLDLKISDVGAMTGVGAMAAYAWATMEVDRENGNSYEKTMTLKGYRGHEEYDKDAKSGAVSILVGGRFVVEANGNNLPIEAIRGAFDKIDLGKLEGMKNVGVKP